LCRWSENPTSARSFVCGLLVGLTFVLKPEFIFASLSMTGIALLARWRWRGLPRIRLFTYWLIGVLLPSALFATYFAQFLPLPRALAVTSQAWLSVFNPAFNRSPLAIRLIGLDHPWPRFLEGLAATVIACAVIFALIATMSVFQRNLANWLRWTVSAALVLAFGWLSFREINWLEIGKCLSGLTLIYFLVSLISFLVRDKRMDSNADAQRLRLLIASLALALMTRMFLNPRIYHYGFYQAALGALLVPAVMIGELPNWFRTKSRQARALGTIATLVIVLPGTAKLAIFSQNALRLKTEAVVSGRDLFYCFPPGMDEIGQLVDGVVNVLRDKARRETVTVLPEGESINYFARVRNSVPHACFYRGGMETETEAELVSDLEKQPPDWIVIVSRDMIAWGIERYGESSGAGQEVLRWVEQNYKKAAWAGGDPLDYRERGVIILRKSSR